MSHTDFEKFTTKERGRVQMEKKDDKSLLTDLNLSNAEWIPVCINSLILPKFTTKNKAYSRGADEWHNIRQMAARNFPEEFTTDPFTAMARVCGLVKDKHEVTLAKSINVPEGDDRLIDCVIYDLFRLRLKLLRDSVLAQQEEKENRQ